MVEFDYVQSANLTEEHKKSVSSKEVNDECNKLFNIIKDVQNVLDDTCLRHLKRT